ncbi:hypothetical protein [Streptomyces sp. NBC_01483]|uniref:hypothetical protein n=1 Tax=Streptomyces sp. NBC_01483 TaxID=2903883 RepID=UPI002E34FA3C|nr:hypothetical protein [Streptomyces sp. NBC_01483]
MSIVARQDVTVLDCTLRDGGYYTNWEFEDTLVEEYLKACAATGVDVVELGYTQFTPSDRGPYGSFPSGITPALRDALPDGHWLRFAVMVDATALAEVPAPEAGPRLRSLLADGPLPVDLVRVAVHHSRTAGVAEAVDSLRTAGFGVCLNLMQVDLATPAEVADLVRLVAGLGPLESVYVADSLGSLHAPRITELVDQFGAGQAAPVGLHGHDNQGFALHNTLAAAQAGATWLDATVLGMGRGAGNTRTEQLLAALGTDQQTLQPMLDLVARRFEPLMHKYRWGASALYAIAGMRRIHPTYVQRLEEGLERDVEVKLRALDFVAQNRKTSFTAASLEDALRHAAV